jgi:putative peptidoglycan lipid II flippase
VNSILNGNLSKQYISLTALSAVVFILSFLAQLIVSKNFGTSTELDAYWVAFSVVNLTTFYFSPFREALLSSFHKHNKSEILLQGYVLFIILALVSSLILVLLELSSFYSTLGSIAHIDTIIKLMPWFILYTFTFGFSEIFTCLLISLNENYFQIRIKIISSSFALIFLVLATPRLGILSLVISPIIGHILSIFFFWHKMKYIDYHYKFSPRLLYLTLQSSGFFSLFYPMLFVLLVSQGCSVFEKAVMSHMKDGLVSSFQYSVSLVNVIVSIIAAPLSNLLWSPFIRSSNNMENKNKSILACLKSIYLLFFGLLIITIFCFTYADDIIYLIFSRGEFNTYSFNLTSETFKIAIFAGIPVGLLNILFRYFLSASDKRSLISTMFLIALMSFLITLYSFYAGNQKLIQFNWLISNSVGLCLGIFFLLSKLQFRVNTFIIKLIQGLIFSSYIYLSTSLVPTLHFGSGKIDVLFFLSLSFLMFSFILSLPFFILYLIRMFKHENSH